MLAPQDRLFKRADIYYYRRRVPTNLRPFFKSPVFVISLKTPQLSNAKRLANCYDLHFDFLNNKAIMDKIDPAKVRKMTVTADGTGSMKFEVSPDDMREMTNMSPDQIAAMISSFSQGIGYKPTQLDTPVKASVELPSPAKAYPTLESLIEQFFAFKKSKKASYVPPKNHLTFLRRLQEILVDVSTIDEITATHVNTVIDKLRKLPVASIRYPNMTVEEIISKVKQDEERLADKTINNHIELYAQVFDYYESYHDKNYINYFAGMRQQADIKDKVKSNQLRSSFTRDDLKTIFTSPRFAQRRYVKNYQYWTPLIALFTGARRAEIASLYREDIYQDKHGIWVMDINLNHEDKRVKTVNSVRLTPLHPWLLKHGMLDFVNSIHHPRIFPELKSPDEDEGYGRNLGENFNGYIHTKLNIEQDKVFHSFRHTFASELSRQGVNDSVIEQLSGREDAGSTTGRKFYIDSADTPTLLTYINKLDFTEELKLVQWKK